MARSGQKAEHHRPAGWARHLAQSLKPAAGSAMAVALERDAGARLGRLRDAGRERVAERRRPSRPRMRALSVAPGGRIGWKSVPAPRLPGPKGAIVHPIAVATCDMDRSILLGVTPFLMPLHFGHECVAEVVEVGSEVDDVKPGDRVVVPFQINCGECSACKAQNTANCLSVPPLAMYGFGVAGGHWGGAVADLLAVPFADAMLLPLPDGVDPAAAASVSDNVCDGYRHVAPHLPALLQRDPEAEVVIIAATSRGTTFSPSMPLYGGQSALALGARRVTFADARPHVRERARELGMNAVDVRGLRRRDPAPLVVDASASADGLKQAINLTAPDGICSSAGNLHGKVAIPTALMFGRNVELRIGRSHARREMPAVLELIAAGKLEPERVTSALGAIDDAPAAIREHACGTAIKTVLTE
jgi:alcohol dehydrogenase